MQDWFCVGGMTQLELRRFRRLPMRSVRPSIQAAALPHKSISAEAELFVCGSVPVWGPLGDCPANGQRQLAGERVPSAIRLRMLDLPRFLAILLRHD